MTKAELADSIKSAYPDLTKKLAEDVLDHVLAEMRKSIAQSRRLQLGGFGIFQVRERKARTGRNPKTKEVIQIPAKKTVTFRPASDFQQAL